jgi:nicotinamidase-related amidase
MRRADARGVQLLRIGDHRGDHAMKKVLIVALAILLLGILILVVNYLLFGMRGSEISEGQPITRTEETRRAVLVIDIQEGITGKASGLDFFVRTSGELIGAVNRIVDSSAAHGVPVIYVKNEISDPLINILNDSMAKGSPGAELDARLRVVSNFVVNKDKGDAFSNPLLDSILTQHKVNRLVFTGLDLGQCVRSTILAAANRKYEICLISDAVISNPDSLKPGLLEGFRTRGCEIISSTEYFQSLQ